ncbi:proline dehydrogenase protein [Rutstroemia sp. NJR-2017a WRK4]|nr:proline dehydrogenase protein [Rutstroemia sp. NJR-2017a WRK4]
MAGLLSHRTALCSNKRLLLAQYRQLSSRTSPLQSTYASEHSPAEAIQPLSLASNPPPTSDTMPKTSPLSILPTSAVIRSLAIMSVSSSPILLGPSLKVMALLANSKSPILSPDHNPILRFFLKHTFYKQFCAGETPPEVQRTIRGIKDLGYTGVFLCYAREVESAKNATATKIDEEKCINNEVKPWAAGTLATVNLSEAGDFVAVKFSGAGSLALHALENQLDPHPALKDAIDEICELGAKRGVKMVFDAEHAAVQKGIDQWTVDYMKKYNKTGKGGAVVYGTYQAYLKACPEVVASHLAIARKENFTLGVKLVRGAYLGSDPRELIHDTKPETDNCYDGIADALVRRSYNDVLRPAKGETEFPDVDVAIAGHNLESVRKTQRIRAKQAENGEDRIELVYAQLQGMADEVSCELVQEGRLAEKKKSELAGARDGKAVDVDVPQAYKYLTWGTTGECMKYLLRRAYENRDAVGRTREGRDEMGRELVRRVKSMFGMS